MELKGDGNNFLVVQKTEYVILYGSV